MKKYSWMIASILIGFLAAACSEEISTHQVDENIYDGPSNCVPGLIFPGHKTESPGNVDFTRPPEQDGENPGVNLPIVPGVPVVPGESVDPDIPADPGESVDPDTPADPGGTSGVTDPLDVEFLRPGPDVFAGLKVYNEVIDIVTPTSHFGMMKYETNSYMFGLCIKHGHCRLDSIRAYNGYCRHPSDHPVAATEFMNCVDYAGAQDFCKWIGGRLPTEKEWEDAATFDGETVRGTVYPWGNDDPELCERTAWTPLEQDLICGTPLTNGQPSAFEEKTSDIPYSWPGTVNSHPDGVSPAGLFNMSGNVAELVADIAMYPDDPGNKDRYSTTYIYKGGSFKSSPEELKVKARQFYKDGPELCTAHWDTIGFRCAFDR